MPSARDCGRTTSPFTFRTLFFRGVLTAAVPLNSQLTFYTRYGDYLGRISEYLMLLCVLYYIAYRAKKKNHLVK